jgi:hypothetical protein
VIVVELDMEKIIDTFIILTVSGLIVYNIWNVFVMFHKLSKRISRKKKSQFARLYRISGIGVGIIFVVGIVSLTFLSEFLQIRKELKIAIEIILYGSLWTMAIAAFIVGFHKTYSRLLVPSLLSGVIILGSIVYAILTKGSPEHENSLHLIYVSLVLSGVLLAKGFLGPIAVASTLSLAAYGLIHAVDNHVPLIEYLVFFILNENNLTLEYLTLIVLTLGSLVSFVKIDLSEIDVN